MVVKQFLLTLDRFWKLSHNLLTSELEVLATGLRLLPERSKRCDRVSKIDTKWVKIASLYDYASKNTFSKTIVMFKVIITSCVYRCQME